MLAGDTDTNCAIVGGLVGAYVGVSKIPKEKLKKVLECNLEEGNQCIRPDFCQPWVDSVDLIMKLISLAPKTLELVAYKG